MKSATVEADGLPPTVIIGAAIQVDSLLSIDVDAVGVLSGDTGGFGPGMWRGTSRALVDTLLPKLPTNTNSAAMRDLMRRLLLSATAVPEGLSKGGGLSTEGSLIALRIRLLAAMGDLDGVGELLKVTPSRNRDRELARIEADVRFLANDNARACGLAAGQFGDGKDPYWHKAFIFCQALAGEMDKATLGLDVLTELGEEDDVFTSLVEGLVGGGPVAVESMPNPSPLLLALARAAKAQLPPNVVSSNRPGILRAIAISPNAPVEMRLDAAERALAARSLPVDVLRQLYTSTTFSEEQLANPLSKSEVESGSLSRALLYRNALIQTVPTARAEAVKLAFTLAREGGRYASTVRVFMDVLSEISPSDEIAWFAPEMIRALLIEGKHEQSAPWFRLLRAGALFNEDSATALAILMPLASLAGSPEANTWTTDQLAEWWKSIRNIDGAPERAAMMYSLFESLDQPVPQRLWEILVKDSSRSMVAMPPPALWMKLKSAAKEKRIGEAVMLSLLALGEGGPGEAEPVVLSRVLTTLRSLGLEAEARALAVEAVLAAEVVGL